METIDHAIDNSTHKCIQCTFHSKIIEDLKMEQHKLQDALKREQRKSRNFWMVLTSNLSKRRGEIGSVNKPILCTEELQENDTNELLSTTDCTTNSGNSRFNITPPTDIGPRSVNTTDQLSLEHCPTIQDCSVFLELKQKLHAFQQITFDSASNVSLLNDFLHLSQQHHHKEQFTFIRKALRRTVFEKQEPESKEYENKMMNHTLSKIHRFYYGSIQKDRVANRYYEIQSTFKNPPIANCNDELYNSYNFGCAFQYARKEDNILTEIKEKRANDEHIQCEKISPIDNRNWITAKYRSFKHELIRNDLESLNMQQFDHEYEKAMALLNTFHCKRKYNCIDVQHVLSLMIYSNFDALQRAFSKTYRVNTDQHEQFFHFGLYLRTAVHRFGTEMCNSSVKQFYHGIGKQVSFPQVGYIQTNCPLSTSSSKEVATHFTNSNEGLIVEFVSGWSGRAKYFPVEWLSDFPHEHECLFVQSRHTIKMNNIIHARTGTECKALFKALNVIETITVGYIVEDISTHTEILIENIIGHQLSPKDSFYNSASSFKVYQSHLINTYCSNKLKVTINYSSKKNKLLQMLFHSEYDWINLKLVTMLFPRLEEISINDICLCSKIFDSVIVHLRACLGSNIRMIVIKPTVNSNLRAELTSAIGTYKTQLNVFNFDIFQQNKHFDQVCIQRLKPLNETITSRHRQKCQTMRTPLSSHALLKPAGKITQIYPHLRL
eukprot:211760_1